MNLQKSLLFATYQILLKQNKLIFLMNEDAI